MSLDSSKRLLIGGSYTDVLDATFLYTLQQTTCKVSFEKFSILALLDIGSHLTCNTCAKKFLKLSSEEKLLFLEYESDKEVASKSRRKKQKLLTRTREALKKQKKKSNQPASGKITSYQVKQLDKLYTKGSAAFGSIANLKKASGYNRGKIVRYLQSKAPNTKYRQFRKSFHRLKGVAYRINQICSVDVAYMDKVAQHNNGVKYLLVTVDFLSGYLRVQSMKALYSKDAVEAFKKMIKKKQPEKVWTDKGSEFKGDFKKFCEKTGIHLYTTENEFKSAFAERNIRSLKNIIYKYLEEKWTWTYIKDLPQFLNIVNSRVNRVTQLAPNKVFKKDEPFLISLAIDTKKYKPKYKEGDLVRIAKPDEKFRKSYKQNYTNEVFTIFKIVTVSPPTYNLIDADNVIIQGKFYEPELVQVNVLDE